MAGGPCPLPEKKNPIMHTRLAILDLAARHRLDAATFAALRRLAGLDRGPVLSLQLVRRALAYIAALLGGLGLIFFVAANWHSLGRAGQFGLLQGLTLLTCVGAALLPRARAPLSLLGLLSIGGLFAYFGQTYQTGADAWQLFALWTALALPLALGARSDVVWAAWVIVASAAIATWSWSLGYRLHGGPVTALVATGLACLTGKPLQRFTGAGPVSFNLAVLIATAWLAASSSIVSLLILLAACGLLAQRALFDVVALSTVALGLLFLVLSKAGTSLLSTSWEIGAVFLLALLALAALAGAVRGILFLNNSYRQQGEAP